MDEGAYLMLMKILFRAAVAIAVITVLFYITVFAFVLKVL